MTFQREYSTLEPTIAKGLEQQATLKQVFGRVSDDFWLWAFTDGYDTNPLLRKILPAMPDPQIQANFTGLSGHPALNQAFNAYTLFKRVAYQHGAAISQCGSILDFGCGWGRVVRFFLKDVDERRVVGVDCYKEMIELCKGQRLRCQLEATPILPPTPFADGAFDIVYLYSVFSHLSEEAHLAWLAEFNRLLKPGGIVLATTRPRSFVTICADLAKKQNLEIWQRGSSASFSDPKQAMADYDAGKFVHSPSGGGGCLDKSFYGESCIPEKYVRRHWTKLFSSVDYLHMGQHNAFDQNVIVAVK